jgi:hypothetical protein
MSQVYYIDIFTPNHEIFNTGSCYSIFSFMYLFCRSQFVPLYFFFAIVLSVLLRYMISDYAFGIFNLFLTYPYMAADIIFVKYINLSKIIKLFGKSSNQRS